MLSRKQAMEGIIKERKEKKPASFQSHAFGRESIIVIPLSNRMVAEKIRHKTGLLAFPFSRRLPIPAKGTVAHCRKTFQRVYSCASAHDFHVIPY